MPSEPQKDLVVEARELAEYVDGLAAGLQDVKLGRASDRLRLLADECERLRELVRHMQFPRGG